jgi:hypothetical protein
MERLRRRWRLVVGLMLVIATVVIGVVSDSTFLQAGFTLFTFFAVIVLIISGGRRGSGGVNPWHHNSGFKRNG